MGLIVHVYRSALGDSSNGGITSWANELCLVNVEGPFEPGRAAAAMLIEHKPTGRNLARIIPAVLGDDDQFYPDKRWLMFGGCYAASSDSRFREAVEKVLGGPFYGAVPIHDRYEP